ncbi:MAG: hypothetical protein IK065_07520, partial [Neisseriaceae bacterium]|nr:hypothetical protein [Neisseriaceae bacterium]
MATLVINNKIIKPVANQAIQIKVKPDDNVQILDENGLPIDKIDQDKITTQGDDLIIFGEDGQPEFVISEYQDNKDFAALLLPTNTTDGSALLASEVADAGMSDKTGLAIGVAAIAGLAIAANSGGSNSSNKTDQQNNYNDADADADSDADSDFDADNGNSSSSGSSGASGGGSYNGGGGNSDSDADADADAD